MFNSWESHWLKVASLFSFYLNGSTALYWGLAAFSVS
jgi:hypothetical protein